MLERCVHYLNKDKALTVQYPMHQTFIPPTSHNITVKDWCKSTSRYRGDGSFRGVSEDIKLLRKEENIIQYVLLLCISFQTLSWCKALNSKRI